MRIDSARFLNIKPEVMELLRNMEIGDTLKGRVLEVMGNTISIRTVGGQIFAAMLQDGAVVARGSLVELLVNNITADGKIYAEFKDQGNTGDIDTKLAELLKQLGLTVDEKNMEAAKLLVKYNLPLDKEAVVKLTGLQKSIENLAGSGEEKAALLLSGLDLKNTPVEVLNRLVLSWPGELQEAAPEGQNTANGSPTAAGAQIRERESGTAAETAAGAKPFIQKADVYVQDSVSNELHKTTAKAVASDSNRSQVSGRENIGPETVQTGAGDATGAEGAKGPEHFKVLTQLGADAGVDVKALAGKVEKLLASIRNADMEALTYLVSKEMDITPGNLGMLLRNIENSDNISQFLDKLQQKMENERSPQLKDIKEAIKKVFMEPEKLEEGREAGEKLKDIARLGEKLEGYLNDKGDKDPEIRDALSNLRDSLDFLKNINQHSNYMQLPLLMNGNASTAKLYVFREGKRSRQINPEDATIVIALDLKSLGHLESLIKVKGKTVSVTFRVESKEIGSIFEKNIVMLREQLKEKGYSLNPIRTVSAGQPFSLLSLEAAINESTPDKIHFDMRV